MCCFPRCLSCLPFRFPGLQATVRGLIAGALALMLVARPAAAISASASPGAISSAMSNEPYWAMSPIR